MVSPLELLKRLEGFRETAYPDGKGYSIGYGHQIVPGDGLSVDSVVTPTQAEGILRQDIAIANAVIARTVTVPLSTQQRTALISFVFNVGETQFRASTLLRKVNDGDMLGASAEFARWVNTTVNGSKVVSDGLIARRKTEQELFIS